MFLDLRGADFLRVQGQAQSRIGDPLDADVLFSGAFPDGQAMFFQAAADAGTPIGNTSGVLSFGRTLAAPPIVLGCIKLTQNYVDLDNNFLFSAGEYLAPCKYSYVRFNAGRRANYSFEYSATASQIDWAVGGFKGIVSFFVIEL